MIRFALIAASTLGFFLTAALGNLMVPLRRALPDGGGAGCCGRGLDSRLCGSA